MGRDCGQIALYAAISSGAIAVAIPEMPFDEEKVFEKIRMTRNAGKRSMLVVVSEGMRNPDGTPYAETLVERIKKETGMDTKFARLAHIIRGGRPTVKDRSIASEMGVKAVELLVQGKSNLVMCRNDGQISPVDIAFALITDRMYKNKLKPGDLDRFTEEELTEMKRICKVRRDEIERLYAVAEDVSV
jgi:6-phosphofructokinase 1